MLLSNVKMTVMTVYCVVSTHSLTYLLTYSLTYLLTHLLTHVDAANNQLHNSPHACYSCSSLYLVADITGLFNEFREYNKFSKSTIILAQHWLKKYFIDENNQRYGSSFTHSLTHSLTHSPTYSLTYSLM